MFPFIAYGNSNCGNFPTTEAFIKRERYELQIELFFTSKNLKDLNYLFQSPLTSRTSARKIKYITQTQVNDSIIETNILQDLVLRIVNYI
jgi:hypothetical protein